MDNITINGAISATSTLTVSGAITINGATSMTARLVSATKQQTS